MSDVEEQIEQWRTGLANSETLGHTDIRELETHLREEIEHLEPLGLSGEEAFLVARHRLGDTAALAGEFLKINAHARLLQRYCWGIMGVLLYFTATTVASGASALSRQLAYMAGLRQINLGLLAGLAEIAAFAGTILLALRLYTRHLYHRVEGHSRDSNAMPVLAAAVLAVGTLTFLGIRILFTQMMWRLASAGDFAKMAYVGAYVDFAFRIAAPVLMAGLFVVLYQRSKQAAQTQE